MEGLQGFVNLDRTSTVPCQSGYDSHKFYVACTVSSGGYFLCVSLSNNICPTDMAASSW